VRSRLVDVLLPGPIGGLLPVGGGLLSSADGFQFRISEEIYAPFCQLGKLIGESMKMKNEERMRGKKSLFVPLA
jgi:hypothetical protein